MEDVQKVLAEWKPKLKEIQKKRYLELCKDLSEEQIQKMLEITGLDK